MPACHHTKVFLREGAKMAFEEKISKALPTVSNHQK
jgi:hypothetical protein